MIKLKKIALPLLAAVLFTATGVGQAFAADQKKPGTKPAAKPAAKPAGAKVSGHPGMAHPGSDMGAMGGKKTAMHPMKMHKKAMHKKHHRRMARHHRRHHRRHHHHRMAPHHA